MTRGIALRAVFTAFPHRGPCGTVTAMQFTEDDLREFMAIWSDEFHETITVEEARLSATMLMDLFAVLAFSGSGETTPP
jgi:hypothetical protein